MKRLEIAMQEQRGVSNKFQRPEQELLLSVRNHLPSCAPVENATETPCTTCCDSGEVTPVRIPALYASSICSPPKLSPSTACTISAFKLRIPSPVLSSDSISRRPKKGVPTESIEGRTT